MPPRPRNIRAPLTKASAREIEKALQKMDRDFPGGSLVGLKVREVTVSGKTGKELVISVRP